MRKTVITSLIISTLPALIVVPLVPFIFILIEGEGKIPGYFHEYLLRTLMVAYPLVLIGCGLYTIRLLRQEQLKTALYWSLAPLCVFLLLVATLLLGGIELR